MAENTTMKAAVLPCAGNADVFEIQTVPRPLLAAKHVLLKVHACGVAQRDVIERKGGHPFMQYPMIQGHEFAGEVIAVADDITQWAIGDRAINLYTDSCGLCDECNTGDERRCPHMQSAYGLTANGGYAEYVAIHERALEPLIDGLSYQQGATLMSAVGVGFNNVINHAKVVAGQDVLVTGASGGVGLAALQTAAALGARVWAVTSSAAKRDSLLQYGAHQVLIDDGQRFHKMLRAELPAGVDVVIDCVGSPTLNSSLRSLKPYGKAVAVGNIDTQPLQLNVGLLVVNALQLLGSDNVSRASLQEVMRWVRDKKIATAIDRVLPLDRVSEAHKLLEERAVFGRVVLQVS